MAQAVLLKDVEGLGEAGTAIDVSPGYLRNYLVPRKLAQPATKGALEEAQRKRERAAEAEKQAGQHESDCHLRVDAGPAVDAPITVKGQT